MRFDDFRCARRTLRYPEMSFDEYAPESLSWLYYFCQTTHFPILLRTDTHHLIEIGYSVKDQVDPLLEQHGHAVAEDVCRRLLQVWYAQP